MLSQKYSITDQQGHVRITFDNTGTGGTAKVRQENSYYAFGLIMPGSTVTTPANPNKHLYNGGSEWQNDFSNLPDYYQSFNRNYDAALGRWIGVDPDAEGAESMSSYQYAGNNPIMYNDPLGDLLSPPGAHLAPYTPWLPLNLGGPPEDIQQSFNSFVDSGGGGGAGDLTGLTGYLDMTGTGPDVTANIDFQNGNVTGNGLTPSQQFVLSNSIQNADIKGLSSDQNGGLQVKYWVDGSYEANGEAVITSTSHTINIGFNGSGSGQGGFSLKWGTNYDGAFLFINYKAQGNWYQYKSYQWIQTVSSSGEFEKSRGINLHSPHVDGSRDANNKLINYPFYWTGSELTFGSLNPFDQYTASFRDYPNGESYFMAEVTLVGVGFNGKLTPLGTYNWGYVTDPSGISTMITPQFSPTPSSFQNGIIQNYNNRIK